MAVIEQRMIGPIEAADLLRYNSGNRNVRERHVIKLASEMASGNWRDTGVPIIVSQRGMERQLQDGQHRLHAIVRAGVTVPLAVSVVNADVFSVIDQGMPRNLADLIGVATGGEDATLLRSIAMSLTYLHFSFSSVQVQQSSNRFRLSLLEEHAQDVAWAKEVHRITRRATARYSKVGYLAGAIAVHRINGFRATEFFNRVATGEMLTARDPAYRLRALLLSSIPIVRGAASSSGRAIHPRWHEAVIRAWNGYVLNADMHVIRITGNAPKILTMPEVMTENVAD